MRQIIALDFDGVIHPYTKGWQGGKIYDAPKPDTIAAIKKLHKKYDLIIHTTRENNKAIWNYLKEYSLDKYIGAIGNKKPVEAKLFIDDRALRFENNWDEVIDQVDEKIKKSISIFGKAIKFGNQIDMFIEGSTKEFGEDDTRKLERTNSGKLRWKAAKGKNDKIPGKKYNKEFEVPVDIDKPIIPRDYIMDIDGVKFKFSGIVDKYGHHKFFELAANGRMKIRRGELQEESFPRHQVEHYMEKTENEKEIKEIKMPENMGEGLSNFYQMIINQVAEGDLREADLLLSDLINDLDSGIYNFITEDMIKHTESIKDYVKNDRKKDAINFLKTLRDTSIKAFNNHSDEKLSFEEWMDSIVVSHGLDGSTSIFSKVNGEKYFAGNTAYYKTRFADNEENKISHLHKLYKEEYLKERKVERSVLLRFLKGQLNMFGNNDQQLGMFGNQPYEKEGTTKQGKGGTLVLKRDKTGKGAHWTLQDKKQSEGRSKRSEAEPTPQQAAPKPVGNKVIPPQKAYAALSEMIGHKANVTDRAGNLLGEGKFLVANETSSGGLSLLIQDDQGNSEFIPVGKDQAIMRTRDSINFSFKDKTVSISNNEIAKIETPKGMEKKQRSPEKTAEWDRMANEYIRNAEAQKDQFLKDLDDASVINGLEAISHTYRKYAVKSKDSIINKFERNESTGKAHKNKILSDTLRGTIKIDRPSQYNAIMESLQNKGYEVWNNDIDNLYENETPGYKHIAVKLKKGDKDPVIKEVLMITPAMYEAKYGFGHDVYDVRKNIQIALGDKIPKSSKAYKLVEQFEESMVQVTNDFYKAAYYEDKKSFSSGNSSGDISPSAAADTIAEPPAKSPSANKRKSSSVFSTPSKRLIRSIRSSLKATWQPILASAVAFSGGNPNLSTSPSSNLENLSSIVNPTIDIINKFASNIINLRKSRKSKKVKFFDKELM